jgi:hypothetical protein
MNPIEDQVRAATRAEASTLREVRPLRLPPEAAAQRVARSRVAVRWPRRWQGWLAPVAAAAVVIALAISLVTIRDNSNGPVVPPTGPVPAAAGVPEYYVTLYTPPQPATPTPTATGGSAPCIALVPGKPECRPASSTDLLVGDTFTGAKVSVVSPPKGTSFYGVTGAADDRTFVVDTDTTPGVSDVCQPRTFYLLKIAPGGSSPAQLTRLGIPPLSCIAAIALSGSGRELAVALLGKGSALEQLRIYSVASGQLLHSWSTRNSSVFDQGADLGNDENRGLSWVDGDRELAFPTFLLVRGAKVPGRNQWDFTEQETVRMLDVSAGGSDLIKDSRVVWSTSSPTTNNYPPGCQWGFDPMVSADGKTVVCVSVNAPATAQLKKVVPWRLSWLAYSVSAPKAPPRTLYEVTVDAPLSSSEQLAQLWINASGSTVIGARGSGFDLEKPAFFGAISGGAVRSLPVPPDVIFGAPPAIAW